MSLRTKASAAADTAFNGDYGHPRYHTREAIDAAAYAAGCAASDYLTTTRGRANTCSNHATFANSAAAVDTVERRWQLAASRSRAANGLWKLLTQRLLPLKPPFGGVGNTLWRPPSMPPALTMMVSRSRSSIYTQRRHRRAPPRAPRQRQSTASPTFCSLSATWMIITG